MTTASLPTPALPGRPSLRLTAGRAALGAAGVLAVLIPLGLLASTSDALAQLFERFLLADGLSTFQSPLGRAAQAALAAVVFTLPRLRPLTRETRSDPVGAGRSVSRAQAKRSRNSRSSRKAGTRAS